MIWGLLVLFAGTYALRQWRRHRRNARGACAFCAATLEAQHFRVEGARVCARCADRTKRRAYIALSLFVALGILTFAVYVFVIIRDWRQGISPSVTLVALALAMPLMFLGMWLIGAALMRGANRSAEELDRTKEMLAALPFANDLAPADPADSRAHSSVTSTQSQN
jgi:predicted transporter